jgi:beta-lactamase class A
MFALVTIALTLFGTARTASAQQRSAGFDAHADSALEARLRPLVDGFRGTAGIYVRHLSTGATVAIRADDLFPTASMIKMPILVGVFDRMERGELGFLDTLVYTDSLLYPGEDILGFYRDSAVVPLAQVLMLMITTSDNTAALWAQHLAGTGTDINAWLDAHGFEHTRVNSRTPGRERDREVYGWGQTTPREMAELLVMIRQGRALSAAASEAMYRHLTRIYWTGEALSQIPPWVQAASKQGAVNRSRSEVALVNAPSGDYVFCVITKEQEDESWEHDNAGFVLLRRVSAILWDHFEPGRSWRPAEGVQRYVP